MNLYRVKGCVKYRKCCDCEYCEGHRQYYDLNSEFEAEDEAGAAQEALLWTERIDAGHEAEWLGEPKVTFIKEITEEMILRQAGYATLPELN